MKGFNVLIMLLLVSGCQVKKPPTQVVYRFDDHRYLELTGYDCEGELWFTDTQRGIHSQLYSQFYRIFTRKFIHPSEHYIAIPSWDVTGFRVSKDYGQTWSAAPFSSSPNAPNGDNYEASEDAISFTVVNEQGFLQTKNSLYFSSKPYDDPRILPGGPGITYTLDDGTVQTIEPRFPGWAWGEVYMTTRGLKNSVMQYRTEWQDVPKSVPEVKHYQGWDHMRCNMDAGKSS